MATPAPASSSRRPLLKPLYSVPELAELAQISVDAMRRRLKKAGLIPSNRRRGEKIEITLTAFMKALPDLWESIMHVERRMAV